MNDVIWVHESDLGSMMSQSTAPSENAIEISLNSLEIMQVAITNLFLFERFSGNSHKTSIAIWVFEGADDDTSKLSETKSFMQESVFKWLLRSEPSSVQPSFKLICLIEVLLLMDFTMMYYTTEGVEGDAFKMINMSYNAIIYFNLFSVSRCLVPSKRARTMLNWSAPVTSRVSCLT